LDLVEIQRHLTVRSDFLTSDIRHHFLMGRSQTAIPVVAILEPGKLLSILFPAVALLPKFGRLNKREQYLDGTGPVHLFTDDRLHLSNGSEAQRQVGVNPRSQFPDHPCAEHQLMTRNLRFRWDLF
jgi:hypothetical protein